MELKGRFRYQVLNEDDVILQESNWMDNIILDIGIKNLNNGYNLGLTEFNDIFIGQGTSIPKVTDTHLDRWVRNTDYGGYVNLNINDGRYAYKEGNEYYVTSCVVGRKLGPFNSSINITELGLGQYKDSQMHLLTRALIKDNFGNPTSVSVPKRHSLIIYYELFQIYRVQDLVENITFVERGVPKNIKVTVRLNNLGANGYSRFPILPTRMTSFNAGDTNGNSVAGYFSGTSGGTNYQFTYGAANATPYGVYYSADVNSRNFTIEYDESSNSTYIDLIINDKQMNIVDENRSEKGFQCIVFGTTRGCYKVLIESEDPDFVLKKKVGELFKFRINVGVSRFEGNLEEVLDR